MLYKKNSEKELKKSLFENPSSEYRATPFWAWNCKLDEDILKRQIGYFKEMGFGGFHMHSRVGMSMKYLGDEFMSRVKLCTDEAKRLEMLAWLYDEDKWPSGFAGGYVTKNPVYRQRKIVFSPDCIDMGEIAPFDEAVAEGKNYYLCSYDIVLNQNGELESYKKIGLSDKAKGDKWNVYSATPEKTGWYNGLTYADTLSKEAIDEFIKITYDSYKDAVGDEFDKTVPAIFTDEPQFFRKQTLKFAASKEAVGLPWTIKMPELFKEYTGLDIFERLPELFWELPEGKVSKFRYLYHDFVSELFARSFADNCGKWCDENNLMFSGHLMEEDDLRAQTTAIGEAMRHYRAFQLPGIDTLCDNRLYNTAKQCQSASHQYGREGVLSELYGVTNWDFDFRGHKLQGDWEAAQGITVRVPHLSWVSMAGEAKRDYPASISYQSPWYKEYKYIEDHFARVNTALTRGKPHVRVGVIHPIESYWLHWGPAENTSAIRTQYEDNFDNFCKWMLFGTVDFDYICESQLPDTYSSKGDNKFSVGVMDYETVIVPSMETIRSTTLEKLEDFRMRGGRVIFAGQIPNLVDAEKSDRAEKFAEKCECISFDKISILDALKDERDVEIRNSMGKNTDSLIYNMRDDEDAKWLFIAHGKNVYGERREDGWRFNSVECPSKETVVITLRGEITPVLYDTLSGEIRKIPFEYKNGNTVINYDFNSEDSLLLKLENKKSEPCKASAQKEMSYEIHLLGKHDYALEEKNVLLLDTAEYSLDGEPLHAEEEILRLDTLCRARLGYQGKHDMPQPWVFEDKKSGHYLNLRMKILSDIDYEGAYLAIEDAEEHEFRFNGKPFDAEITGYFTDEAIKTIKLPKINKGENILEVKLDFSIRSNTEWCYVLGDFGVRLEGTVKTIVPKREKIGYAPLFMHDMPFYGGNVVYKNEVDLPDCDINIRVNHYKGAVLKVYVDGKDEGYIAFAPYKLAVKNLKKGRHTVEVKLFGNRINSFGALHFTNRMHTWYGPGVWRTEDVEWSYEYNIREMGVLAAPVIEVFEK